MTATTKTILITGATDGIGLETARLLRPLGHHLLLHGRNPDKLARVERELSALPGSGKVEGHLADLSSMAQVEALAGSVSANCPQLDVLINNAGILKAAKRITEDGLDIRFAVNTLAPWLLTRRLLPRMPADGRVINLSSAAQATVDLRALAGERRIDDDLNAYAQSKLALTHCSLHLARQLPHGPVVVAVNPGSLLASKMVREGFGVAGNDIRIGARILLRAALDDAFADASGRYFDNDAGRFAEPHADALDADKSAAVAGAIEALLARP